MVATYFTFYSYNGYCSAIAGILFMSYDSLVSITTTVLLSILLKINYTDVAGKIVFDYRKEAAVIILCLIISIISTIYFLVIYIWYIVKMIKNRKVCMNNCCVMKEIHLHEDYQIMMKDYTYFGDDNEDEYSDVVVTDWNLKKWNLILTIFIFVSLILLFIISLFALIPFSYTKNINEYEKCDPIDDSECIFPYPSSFYLKKDDSTETGFKVDFGSKSFPVLRFGKRLSLDRINEKDGFSIASTLMFSLNGGTVDGLTSYKDVENYNKDSVNSILINLDTKELIPHFIELDMTDDNDENRPFLVNPVKLLDYNSHYFFAIRNIKDKNGNILKRKPSFDAFLKSNDDRANRYINEYFPLLNWPQSEIQIAWDFKTNSQSMIQNREKLLINDVNKRLSSNIKYEIFKTVIKSSCESSNDLIWKQVHGKVYIPLYIKGRNDKMNIRLDAKASDITPEKDSYPIYFISEIPCSLYLNPEPAKLLQVGHGFLVDRGEIRDNYIRYYANSVKAITFSTEWFTFSDNDLISLARLAISDVENFYKISDTFAQGLINQYSLSLLMQKGLSNEPTFIINNVNLLPKTDNKIEYLGSSLGGIVGAAYISINKNIPRACFTVPSAGFSNTCMRSGLFSLFNLLFNLSAHKQRDIRICMMLIQEVFDVFETSGWLNILKDKELFVQSGIDDSHVHNIQTHLLIRSLNAKLLEIPYRNVSLVETVESPSPSSVVPFIEWKYKNAPVLSATNEFIESTVGSPHNCVRSEPESVAMMKNFYKTGTVTNLCSGGGPCIAESCDL